MNDQCLPSGRCLSPLSSIYMVFYVFFFLLVFEVLFVGREGGDLTDDLPSSPGTVSLMK